MSTQRIGGFVVMAILLAACTSTTGNTTPSPSESPTAEPSLTLPALDSFPDGFETEYLATGTSPTFEGEIGTETIHFWKVGGAFSAGSGTMTFTETLVTGAPVTCGGVDYEDPSLDTSNLSNPQGQLVGTLGAASILLMPDLQVGVFPTGGTSFPTCWEQTGTYTLTFTEGPTPGIKTGSYLLTLERLTLN